MRAAWWLSIGSKQNNRHHFQMIVFNALYQMEFFRTECHWDMSLDIAGNGFGSVGFCIEWCMNNWIGKLWKLAWWVIIGSGNGLLCDSAKSSPDVDKSSMRSWSIRRRTSSLHKKCSWKISILDIRLEIINLRFQPHMSYLTHWDRVMHMCVSKLTIIGSDNGLSPGRRQAII